MEYSENQEISSNSSSCQESLGRSFSTTSTYVISNLDEDISETNDNRPLLNNRDIFEYNTFEKAYFEQPSLDNLMPSFGHTHYR